MRILPTTLHLPARWRRFPTHIVVFLAPAAVIYTLFMIYPLFDSLRLGFFAEEVHEVYFVGIQNYARLLTDPIWQPQLFRALKNSFLFFAINMFVQNPIALLLAALLAARTRGGMLYRTLLFAPATLSLVIVAFIWELLLNPIWGIAKDILRLAGLGALAKPWLGLESTALPTLALISAWQYVGVPMMLYYASLIAIPHEQIEAAYVDGATDWQTFWRIKLPLILPMVGIVSLMTYIYNFNAFDVIYAVKGPFAGPNYATDTMMTFFFRTFFGFETYPRNLTMGATIAGTMFVLLLAGVFLYFVWRRRVETYEL